MKFDVNISNRALLHVQDWLVKVSLHKMNSPLHIIMHEIHILSYNKIIINQSHDINNVSYIL